MLVVALALSSAAQVAHAERKRVVVLEFEGPKGEKFHDELVRLIKKTHTVVSTNQWNGTAEQLDAVTLLDKDVRRVAKKLKIDAIVEGKIEKRRSAFLIRLKLREGKTGEVVRASIGTKADGPRIDARAQRDLKDELVGAIDEVESNHAVALDEEAEEEDRPAKKRAKKRIAKADEEVEDDRPAKKRAKQAEEEDEDSAPTKKARKADDDRGRKVAKRAEAEDDEDALPSKKAKRTEEDDEDQLPARKTDGRAFSKRPDDERGSDRVDDEERALLKPKTDEAAGSEDDGEDGRAEDTRVASRDDDSTRVEVEFDPGGRLDAATARSPGQRAIELSTGASMTVRRMSFKAAGDLLQRPAEYKGGRSPGAVVDATLYPLALSHSRSGIGASILKDLGVTVMYDRALKVSSRSQLTNMTVDTKETRFAAGLVFRHAFGTGPTAPVVLASVAYGTQVFRLSANFDVPAVHYKMFEPGLGLRFPATANLIFGLDARFLAITSAGQIQQPTQYGTARVLGLEGALAIDYVFGGGVFARAAFRYETIGYTFKGNGLMTINRDRIGSTQDVTGARDNYFGGLATLGYLY